jgi:hypothetical protein
MKTLREMMDQLDEITRRDLLKGAGAASALGGAAAVGYKAGQSVPAEIPRNPQVYYLIGYLLTALPPESAMRDEIVKLNEKTGVEIISNPGPESKALDLAHDKGLKDGYRAHKTFDPEEFLATTHTEKSQARIKKIERHAKPYYDKLQSLLKQPVQEASPEAMAKINELTKS